MLEKFAAEAQLYVEWARGCGAEDMNVATALRRIVALYAAALHLPDPSTAQTELEDWVASPRSSDETRLIYRRAATLPIRHYGEVFNPLPIPPEEPVTGDVADDIADIFQDVVAGLQLYEAGRRAEALWQWGCNFQIHWGEHATGAIRALHCYLAQQAPEGLSQ